ncbi:MAG: (Na+)-NQR maturation NqrM [Gammaproteobacteria bacterium]
MQIVLITLVFLLIIFAAMAVGLMLGRGPIKGSCGGIAALTGERTCDLCGGDRVRCEEINGEPNPGAKGDSSAEGKVERFDPRAPR